MKLCITEDLSPPDMLTIYLVSWYELEGNTVTRWIEMWWEQIYNTPNIDNVDMQSTHLITFIKTINPLHLSPVVGGDTGDDGGTVFHVSTIM